MRDLASGSFCVSPVVRESVRDASSTVRSSSSSPSSGLHSSRTGLGFDFVLSVRLAGMDYPVGGFSGDYPPT